MDTASSAPTRLPARQHDGLHHVFCSRRFERHLGVALAHNQAISDAPLTPRPTRRSERRHPSEGRKPTAMRRGQNFAYPCIPYKTFPTLPHGHSCHTCLLRL
jgi:hypothetical protein